MSTVRSKPFRPGTTGWTASDLDDPRIEARWEWGRYEIINGVLTRMPAAYYGGGEMLANLLIAVGQELKAKGIRGGFSIEADIIIDQDRVVKGDSCYLSASDKKKQEIVAKRHGKPDGMRTRVYVPPTIVIESISPGHQRHDRVTKFAWYAEFGVRNFWIIDTFKRTFDEFVLLRGKYKHRSKLAGNAIFRPAAFAGIEVKLRDVWPAKA